MYRNQRSSDEAQILLEQSKEMLQQYHDNRKTAARNRLFEFLDLALSRALEAYRSRKDPSISKFIAPVYFRIGQFFYNITTTADGYISNYYPTTNDLEEAIKYFNLASKYAPKNEQLTADIKEAKQRCLRSMVTQYRKQAVKAANTNNRAEELRNLNLGYSCIQEIDIDWAGKQKNEFVIRFFLDVAAICKYLHRHNFSRDKNLGVEPSLDYLEKNIFFLEQAANRAPHSFLHKYLSALDVYASELLHRKQSESAFNIISKAEAQLATTPSDNGYKRKVAARIRLHKIGIQGRYHLDSRQAFTASEEFKQAFQMAQQLSQHNTSIKDKKKYQKEACGYKHLFGVARVKYMVSFPAEQLQKRAEIAQEAITAFLDLNEFRKAGLVWCIFGDCVRKYNQEYHDQGVVYYQDGIELIKQEYQGKYPEEFEVWYQQNVSHVIVKAENVATSNPTLGIDTYKQARDLLIKWGDAKRRNKRAQVQMNPPLGAIDPRHMPNQNIDLASIEDEEFEDRDPLDFIEEEYPLEETSRSPSPVPSPEPPPVNQWGTGSLSLAQRLGGGAQPVPQQPLQTPDPREFPSLAAATSKMSVSAPEFKPKK